MAFHPLLSKKAFYFFRNATVAFRHEKLLDMEQNIFALPRRTFCWLDEKNVIVISKNSRATIGHCELVNTVSFMFALKGLA